jgi:hypothetical protein
MTDSSVGEEEVWVPEEVCRQLAHQAVLDDPLQEPAQLQAPH